MACRAAAAAALGGLGLLPQAVALGEATSWVATALDVGHCLGTTSDDKLVVEPCLGGTGVGFSLTPEDADKETVLRMAKNAAKCLSATSLAFETCDGSVGQQRWTWSYKTLQLKHGGQCLGLDSSSGKKLTMQVCETLPELAVGQDWSTTDQNSEGAPAYQTWVLLPTVRPQVDILDTLNFPLRVSGRYVIDAAGTPVKLVGVNWVGAHLAPMVNYGLNYLEMETLAKYIKHMGFNHVRLNYALSMLHAPGQPMKIENGEAVGMPVPEASSAYLEEVVKTNPELKGMDTLQLFDASVKALTDQGLLVILNNHMSDAGWCCGTMDGNGLWFNENYTASDWLTALTFMSKRYKDNQRVFAHDIRNEPRPDLRGFEGFGFMGVSPSETESGCPASEAEKPPPFDPRAPTHGLLPWWGLETDWLKWLGIEVFDWRRAASQGAVATWKGDPEMNVIVEGTWYASNLAYVRELPLSLAQDCLQSRLFYSVHEYPWFSLIYGIWDYASNPFRWNTMLSDLKNFFGTEEEERSCIEQKHPYSEIEYPRFKDMRSSAGWNLVEDGFAPVWVSEFGTGRRASRRWYNNTFQLLGDLDADWAWWPLDVDKTPVGGDAANPEGEMDAAGIYNPGYRNYKSVVGWKLQDLIAVMAPKADYPTKVDIPDECSFDLSSNEAAADAPTDNMLFLRTLHWTWYMVLWWILVILILVAPCWLCCCVVGCVCCRKRATKKVSEEETQSLLNGTPKEHNGDRVQNFLACCRR